MRKPLETLQDLMQEFKLRAVYWAICVFAITYFLSHTSKSMWTNVPISIIILCTFRYLSYEVDLRWKAQPVYQATYLSHLEKKQISMNDSRLSCAPGPSRWKRKIGSPPVEAAINDFIDKILQDFVIDLWYSDITPDKEGPELIRSVIRDSIGEVSGRVKEINLVDLLTRDLVELVGNHLDLFRKNEAAIGVNVMGTLSSEERDEKLKQHLMASGELHPALVSSDCEYKVLQRIIGGVMAVVLKQREAQCPLVRCLSREFLTCLVMQPIMNFASPIYINELIEYIFLANGSNMNAVVVPEISTSISGFTDQSVHMGTSSADPESMFRTTSNQSSDTSFRKTDGTTPYSICQGHQSPLSVDPVQEIPPRAAEWAAILDAATKRRSQVLAPENLENMWTKGRNYKKKITNLAPLSTSVGLTSSSGILNSSFSPVDIGNAKTSIMSDSSTFVEDKYMIRLMLESVKDSTSRLSAEPVDVSSDHTRPKLANEDSSVKGCEGNIEKKISKTSSGRLKRSSSTPDIDKINMDRSDEAVSKKPCNSNLSKHKSGSVSDLVNHSEGLCTPKIKCRVVGAYFEKIGSTSVAVYSIAVTDSENRTWFVKRRYRNFERLHRYLKDIPNYSLQLPPKRFLSSSIDDYFVHQRCILLDKYLQDLLLIANVAEQHEVWDFLSVSSKNYSYGKSTSVMRTLAVNVDDAMDDIVRQFKGVSDGLRRAVVGSTSSHLTSPLLERNAANSWSEAEMSKKEYGISNFETSHSLSEEEARANYDSSEQIDGWHSDNELNSKSFPPRVVKHIYEPLSSCSLRGQQIDAPNCSTPENILPWNSSKAANLLQDPDSVPPDWTPPNVSVPLLTLVDKIFLLNQRGWLRRQVFWISKQILQLMMEDAIDDWMLKQINWLRNEKVITQGVCWVQDVLWPNGTFFVKIRQGRSDENSVSTAQIEPQTSRLAGLGKGQGPSSFEVQLEAARRASNVRKMLLDGSPAALVSLIGRKQFCRCAKDIYYFTQSTVCLKQLAYGMLEVILLSVFPELRDLIRDIHEKR